MAVPKVNLAKVKRKNGFVYQVDYTINGKRHREVVGSNKHSAELFQTRIQNKIMDGKLELPAQQKKKSIQDLYEDYINLKQNLSQNSKKRYQAYFSEFIKFLKEYFPHTVDDLTKIKTSYIKESIDHFTTSGTSNGKIWKPKTANGYKVFLASLFKYGLKKVVDLKENPVSDIPDLKIEQNINVKFYNKDEVDKILEKIDPHWVNYFTFILNTGLRKGEINNLTWDNVSISNSEIIIASNKDWKTKNRKSRRIKLNNTAMRIIMDQKGKNNTYVFAQINGNKINPDRPYQVLKRTLKKLNLEGDVHKFRHTFGSNFIMKRAGTIYELQQIMGHSDINVTKIYAHLSDDHQLNSMKKLEEQ